MTTLVLGPPPPELDALIERRRQAGVDRLDEVWQGFRQMVPGPSFEHAHVAQQLGELLGPLARAAGLVPTMHEFNLGESEHDFRVPDGACTTPEQPACGTRQPPSSWRSSSRATRAGRSSRSTPSTTSDEVLLVDPAERTVTWLALRDRDYGPIQSSGLIELGSTQLAEQLDWP
jgi:hypothetical protein